MKKLSKKQILIGNENKTDKRCSIRASFYYIIGIITILS